MRLEVNGQIAAENADANSIKYLIGDLHSETETSILLHDAEGVYLQANGVPKQGFSLYYTNNLTGVEYVSKNKKLKPRAVMRVLKHYLARDVLWRVDITWLPVTEAAVAEQKARAWRRSKPVILGMIALVISYLPLLFLLHVLSDQLVYMPLCAQTGAVFSHFSHGNETRYSRGSYSAPTCWYTDGSSTELSVFIGDGAVLLDLLVRFAEFLFPLFVVLALLYAIARSRQLATARQPAE